MAWNVKTSMFCVPSGSYQHFGGEIVYASESKLSKELQNGIEILVSYGSEQ